MLCLYDVLQYRQFVVHHCAFISLCVWLIRPMMNLKLQKLINIVDYPANDPQVFNLRPSPSHPIYIPLEFSSFILFAHPSFLQMLLLDPTCWLGRDKSVMIQRRR